MKLPALYDTSEVLQMFKIKSKTTLLEKVKDPDCKLRRSPDKGRTKWIGKSVREEFQRLHGVSYMEAIQE